MLHVSNTKESFKREWLTVMAVTEIGPRPGPFRAEFSTCQGVRRAIGVSFFRCLFGYPALLPYNVHSLNLPSLVYPLADRSQGRNKEMKKRLYRPVGRFALQAKSRGSSSITRASRVFLKLDRKSKMELGLYHLSPPAMSLNSLNTFDSSSSSFSVKGIK